MMPSLKIFFTAILVTMTAVAVWASLQVPLWETPQEMIRHPWFLATLFDAYFGFLIMAVWMFYRERSAAARAGWFVAFLTLGNIAVALYVLVSIARLKGDVSIEKLLLARKEPA